MKHALAICLLALLPGLTLALVPPPGLQLPQTVETVEPEIKVQDAPQDEAIQSRLIAVLNAIEGLEKVEVDVSAGVVRLTGTIPSSRAARELIGIAERLEGVVYVQNRLNEEMDVSARVRPATRAFQEMGSTALQMLPVALVAFLVLTIFWFLGKWAGQRGRWLQRIGLSELASLLGLRVIRTLITGIGFLLALEILDITALFGALLGVAGVVGIAVGFAFRNIVENYLAGVLLSARNPFDIGDHIEVNEFRGKVVRLTSRDTVLMTLDGNHLRIPNNVIITSALTNFSRNPLRRFEFNLGVAEDTNLVTARELGIATLRRMKGVLPEPGPQVLIADLGDSSVQLRFSAWIDQHDTDFPKARSEAIRLVKSLFDEIGIEMPEPIYRIHLEERANAHLDDSADPNSEAQGADRQRSERQRSDKPHRRPARPQSGEETTPESADVAADRSIDKQVEHELRTSMEENLLIKE